ncbi:hypothetical protein, partial [Weissella fangxianensis]|uniref:hypothetical protein n=1 Tax=Weissella fangxianensis TaxID=2953879 RepID=UPI00215746D2
LIVHLNKRLLKFFFVLNHIKKCSYAISLQGRRKSVRKSSIRAKDQLLKDGFVVNTILKEADLFCPNSVRINFTIYLISFNIFKLIL